MTWIRSRVNSYATIGPYRMCHGGFRFPCAYYSFVVCYKIQLGNLKRKWSTVTSIEKGTDKHWSTCIVRLKSCEWVYPAWVLEHLCIPTYQRTDGRTYIYSTDRGHCPTRSHHLEHCEAKSPWVSHSILPTAQVEGNKKKKQKKTKQQHYTYVRVYRIARPIRNLINNRL